MLTISMARLWPRWHGLISLILVSLVTLLAGCSRDSPEPGAPAPRPSFLLFILDTTRFDAVSAYGFKEAITPTIDRLASTGLLFTRAFAQAPWTLPSHLTIFTGLLPSQHRVGWRETRAPDELVMLAELLQSEGYETFGVSENTWISEAFNVAQGFDEFIYSDAGRDPKSDPEKSRVVREVGRWAKRRDPKSSFFVFVNVVDPHAPYLFHPHCESLPWGLTPAGALRVPQDPAHYMCVADRASKRLDILRALYRCDVSAADRKLNAVFGELSLAAEIAGHRLISVVTSDHGEHFGEHGLVSHQFSVRDELLHVPLVVHGLEDVAPAVIDDPVQLADLAPSILEWAGLRVPETMAGRVLPSTPQGDSARLIIAEYADYESLPSESALGRGLIGLAAGMRRKCTERDRVFGDMRAIIRFPFKLTLYERYAPELFNLAADPREAENLADRHTAEVEELRRLLAALPETQESKAAAPPARRDEPEVSEEVLRLLESLGYVERPPQEDAGRPPSE